MTKVVTDNQERFEVFLKPDSYELIPDGVEDRFPLVKRLVARVEKKQFTPVTIVYDSGIR